MIRTQVYLTRLQYRSLQCQAAEEGVSMTAVLRRIIDVHLGSGCGAASLSKETVTSFIGLGASGRADTSERHDEALKEDLGAGPAR